MPDDLRSDAELLRDNDNPASYATLVIRHRARIESRVRRYVRDDDAVHDVCQEILIDLWASPRLYDPGRGTLAAYLSTVCTSRSIDWIRSQSARVSRESAWTAGRQQPTDPNDVITDPVVLAAIDRLPVDERDLIRAAFLLDLTHQQIARDSGIPIGTVKTRIRRALHRLRAVTALAAFAD